MTAALAGPVASVQGMPPSRPRMTLPTQLVLQALFVDPSRETYGRELARAIGLADRTVYQILTRLEQDGWVLNRCEDVNPAQVGRPRHRFYRPNTDRITAVRDRHQHSRERMMRFLARTPATGLMTGGSEPRVRWIRWSTACSSAAAPTGGCRYQN